MKIQNINFYSPVKNIQQINKKEVGQNKEVQKSSLEMSAVYNVSFCSLFGTNQNIIDASVVVNPIQMEPNKKYFVDKDAVLELGPYDIVDLQSKKMKPYMDILDSGAKVIIGRDTTDELNFSGTVSRKHLKLAKNRKGQIIVEDLNSKNGTKIRSNVEIPNLTKGEFHLKPNKHYFLPMNSVFNIAGLICPLIDYASDISKMRDGEAITLGRLRPSDIIINNDYVSAKHLNIRRYKGGVIVTDLNSTNGTSFVEVSNSGKYWDKDFYSIDHKTVLKKNVPTLLPKKAQLYLGEELTIDIRNKNILKLLDEQGEIVIGRSEDCDIIVPEFYDRVSRKHLLLQKQDSSNIVATDLGSLNETMVIPENEIEPFYGGVANLKLGQGNVGDCYLLSTIYSLSQNRLGQALLRNMVSIDEDGNYIVKFYDREPIVVKLEELDGQKRENGDKKISVSGDLGIKAIERAYAKTVKRNYGSDGTMFSVIDDGGNMRIALWKMTGIGSSYYKTKENDMDSYFHQIAQDGIQNHIITCATPDKGKYHGYVDRENRFIENHAYSIKYIDSENKRVGIVNPHNTKKIHDISWDEYKAYFEWICDASTKNIY